MSIESITIIVLIIISLFMVGLLIKLTYLFKKLSDSSNKLGFLIREDAKKYFDKNRKDELGIKQKFLEENKTLLKEAMIEAINVEKATIEDFFDTTNEKTIKIIEEARLEASSIAEEAKEDAAIKKKKVIENISYIVEDVVKQYIKKDLSSEDQKQIINDLLQKRLKEDE